MSDQIQRNFEISTPAGEIKLAVVVDCSSLSTIQVPQQEDENYKKGVMDCHKILDGLGIPTAKGVVCTDPECDSPIGHRLRTFRDKYLLVESVLGSVASLPNLPAEVTEILNGRSKNH